MPVEVALDHPEANHRVVDRGQRLVEPWLMRGDLRRQIDQRQASELVVEMDVVVAHVPKASKSSAISLSLGVHRAAATFERTCDGLVAPAITVETTGFARSAPMATSVIDTSRAAA